MEISLIVAMSRNRVIGRDNQLPWRLPEDLKHFKRVTMGKPVVMGRRTFESIGAPLPGRTNIVLTRNPRFVVDGVHAVRDLRGAMALCGESETMIIGGAEIFRETLPLSGRIYLTEVHAEVEGDTYFPAFNRSQWRETARQDYRAGGDVPYDYSFVILERNNAFAA